MFHSGQSATVFGLFSLRASQIIGPSSVEDTYLTLAAAIPFQVGVNNSLIILPLQAYKKKWPSFRSSRSYNSLFTYRKDWLSVIHQKCFQLYSMQS